MANIYSTSPVVNAGSTAHTVFTFGLDSPAKYLRVYNAGSVDLFVNLEGSAPSTGGGSHIVRTLTDMTLQHVPTPILALGLTTTSTTAAGQRVAVLAISG